MPVWKPGTQIKCDGCERVLVDTDGIVEHYYTTVPSRFVDKGTQYDDEGRRYRIFDFPNACAASRECVEKIEASDRWQKRQLATPLASEAG